MRKNTNNNIYTKIEQKHDKLSIQINYGIDKYKMNNVIIIITIVLQGPLNLFHLSNKSGKLNWYT